MNSSKKTPTTTPLDLGAVDPKDGFHATRVTAYGTEILFVSLWSEGREIAAAEVARVSSSDRVACGSLVRLSFLAEAIARFRSTGGTVEELTALTRAFGKMPHVFDFSGWHYVTGWNVPNEGVYQHVFATLDESGDAILWQEPMRMETGNIVGGFVDRTTLLSLFHETDKDREFGFAEGPAGEEPA
jgi:hypothetical protein